jgi:hypothetical protein
MLTYLFAVAAVDKFLSIIIGAVTGDAFCETISGAIPVLDVSVTSKFP